MKKEHAAASVGGGGVEEEPREHTGGPDAHTEETSDNRERGTKGGMGEGAAALGAGEGGLEESGENAVNAKSI